MSTKNRKTLDMDSRKTPRISNRTSRHNVRQSGGRDGEDEGAIADIDAGDNNPTAVAIDAAMKQSKSATRASLPPGKADAIDVDLPYHLSQSRELGNNNDNDVAANTDDIGISSEEFSDRMPRGMLMTTTAGSGGVNIDKSLLPLNGLSFFLSAVDSTVRTSVINLGGKLVGDLSSIPLDCVNIIGHFFLSHPKCRLHTKYILAAALGVPMLHYKCIDQLRAKFEHYMKNKMGKKKLVREEGENEEKVAKRRPPTIFDSPLYRAWRLPVGLPGHFVLQRARPAKEWLPPGSEHGRGKEGGREANIGKAVFHSLTLDVALNNEQAEKEWK